jgi:hypothetical protein
MESSKIHTYISKLYGILGIYNFDFSQEQPLQIRKERLHTHWLCMASLIELFGFYGSWDLLSADFLFFVRSELAVHSLSVFYNQQFKRVV